MILDILLKIILSQPTGSEENIAKKLAEKSINKDQAEFDKEVSNRKYSFYRLLVY